MSSSEQVRRLSVLQRHIKNSGSSSSSGTEVSVFPEETRALRDLASDAFNMATKGVAYTERHGGDLVSEVLRAHGVQHIFCLSGGHISPFLVSCQRDGIRIVDVRHEVNAVFAADAVSRLSGKPGVAAVTAGPGVTNTVTAVKNAAMAQSPLVLLGGAAATLMQGRGSLQDIDHLAFLRPICKFVASCRTVRDVVPTLRKAFQEAASGVPGPVFVELPLDVLYPVLEMLPQAGTHARLRAGDVKPEHLPRVVVPREQVAMGRDARAFVDSKPKDAPVFVELPPEEQPSLAMRLGFSALLSHLHAGAHDTVYDFSPLPVTYPTPRSADVSKVAGMLRAARRPVLVLQSQCMLHGEAGANALAKALHELGAPCFLGGMARGLLGRDSPLHARQNRGKALRGSDLILLCGTSADFRLDYGRALPAGRPVVTINRSEDELTLNTDLFWTPKVAALADPSDFLRALASELAKDSSSSGERRGAWGEWAAQLKRGDAEKEAANAATGAQQALGRNALEGQPLVNPLQLFQDLESVLGDNAILVADGGDFVATGSYILRPRGPLGWLDPGAFGTLGVGGGFALGAAMLHPEKQVWILWGDGSAGYSLLEFDSFARHGAKVVALVGNDACWTQIEREQVPMFQSDVSCVLEYLDYEKAAEGLGGIGMRIDGPDEDAKDVLRRAQETAQAQGKPVLVNARIGRTSFREGSLSV